MITFKQSGNFKKLNIFFETILQKINLGVLDKYGRQGVEALSRMTPIDTGKTASSWSYEITKTNNRISLNFNNSNVVDGVPIAVILQYGHLTENRGWVEGVDYINPALKPIFEELANTMWKELIDK